MVYRIAHLRRYVPRALFICASLRLALGLAALRSIARLLRLAALAPAAWWFCHI